MHFDITKINVVELKLLDDSMLGDGSLPPRWVFFANDSQLKLAT